MGDARRDGKLATIVVHPPIADAESWSVEIEPVDDTAPGDWREFPTAAEAFAHTTKWITDRGLRMTCEIHVYPSVREVSDAG